VVQGVACPALEPRPRPPRDLGGLLDPGASPILGAPLGSGATDRVSMVATRDRIHHDINRVNQYYSPSRRTSSYGASPRLPRQGIDIMAVPAAVADQLGLVKFSDVVLAGDAGPTVLAASYVVNLTLDDLDMGAVEVVLTDETYIILGCGILNQFQIILDGPHL
jgi:hypothetical protein